MQAERTETKRRSRFPRERAEFDRGLSFFDAAYGFAITLLIANVDIPPAEAWESISKLLDHGLGDQLLGFLISFVVIAVFWMNNFRIISSFSAMNPPVIVANLASTILIIFLPFTTQAISDPGVSDMPLSTALYALNVALAVVAQSVTFEIGRAHGLIEDDDPPGTRWPKRLDVYVTILVFLVSIPIAFTAGTDWGRLTWLLLIVTGPLVGRWSARKTLALRARAATREHA